MYRDDLVAAMSRAEAGDRKKQEPNLLQMHLENVNDPPGKVRFACVRGVVGGCTILVDDDNEELALAYRIGWLRVTAACVGWERLYGEPDGWRVRKNTKQRFWGSAARSLRLALQALHIKTRAKGPL